MNRKNDNDTCMNKKIGPVMLMILDGFGFRKELHGNAVLHSKMPNYMNLWKHCPHTTLEASGEAVGLPSGQMGNSEVGHLNIGAGRVVYQELSRISRAIESGEFFKNHALISAMDHAVSNNSKLHIWGLLSDGGVHSHINHLFALIKMAKEKNVNQVYIHCFTDGRDVPPKSGINYIKQLEKFISEENFGEICTVSGRYYSMDRDKRWERVELAYNALAKGIGKTAVSAEEALLKSYEQNETDEFIVPTVINRDGAVSDNDAIIMFNFRPDRAREITRAFVDPKHVGFKIENPPENLHYTCMTQYDETMPDVSLAYPPEHLENTLGEYISSLGLKQLRIAETEKYAHVTFFFNGGVEKPNKFEDRILIPSPKVATYDLQPEMSAPSVCKRVLEELDKNKYSLFILNFANPDMVGHTGNMDATISALEYLDTCIGKISDKILNSNGHLLITADHGNSDYMLDDYDNIVTSHSLSPVPLIYVHNDTTSDITLSSGGILADIAPTLLDIMKIKKPAEMTGHSLITGYKKS